MLKNKPLLSFGLKWILFYALLSAPFLFYDSIYGDFYRGISKMFFGKFHGNGVAIFKPMKEKFNTHIDIGNVSKVKSNGAIDTATADFNTRFRGYLPTVLFLSLVFASPVSRRRRMIYSLLGIVLMTLVVMLKQWIHILYICSQSKWLELYVFTENQERKINFFYVNFANYNGPSLIFAIALWILLTFRIKDIDLIFNVKQ